MKTIIASTDFSPVSLNAVNYAADMAMAVGADLLLVNIYTLQVIYTDGPLMPIPAEELRENSEKELEKIRTDVLRRTNGRVMVHTKARLGNVTEELEDICNQAKPFAVVIGTRGKSRLEKRIFGSSTLSIIRHLHWPVLCIPPRKTYEKGIREIVLACDFKEVTDTIPTPAIKDFVGTFKATLHIVNVDYRDKHFEASTPGELTKLSQLLEKEDPHYHFIDNPDVEDGIYEFIQTHTPDLLIVIPKKHGLLHHLFKPGSTKQLIAALQIPILCIHK